MRNKMKNIAKVWRSSTAFLLSAFSFLILITSCSNELDDTLQPVNNVNLQFVVSDFPAFGESGLTRAIGTQDEGKTAWADGDKILVHLYSQKFGDQAVTLTFDAESNTWGSDDASLNYLENETPTITAVYAPDCEINSDETIGLLEGKKYGEEEYIPAKTAINGNTLDIRFESGRNYSRLRIAAMPEATLTVSTEGFTPAGATALATEPYTLTTDDNGNAFLYGTFAEGATVTVKQGDFSFADYTFAEATEAMYGYALEARPIIDGTLGGKTEATEEELAAMVELLKNYIENGHTTIIVTGSQPAKLFKDGYLTPVVSLAFEQLTYAYQDEKIDSYWGTVDLIYQDVKEIVEYEFYCCDVLKSITLPNVTTVGDRGFWACYYLETLTFGSVVTAINDNSGEVFYDLGYKIDGCNLVLNSEQTNAAADYQPSGNTWWNTEWKSITLK